MFQLASVDRSSNPEISSAPSTVELVNGDVENRSLSQMPRAEKQELGYCVRKACRKKAEDGDYCARHAKSQRAYHRSYMKRRRAEWSAANRCSWCGDEKSADVSLCPACLILDGRVPRKIVKADVENHAARVSARKIEWTDSPTNQGRKNRLRGGKRGRRSVADDDHERIVSLERFVLKLKEGRVYANSAEVRALPPIQRAEATQAAMSWAALIYRTCAEMLTANEYPIPDQIAPDDDSDED